MGTGLVVAAGGVLEEVGDSREGGGGTAGGGGGTTSWVFEDAVGDPGGGAGAGVLTPPSFWPTSVAATVCLVTPLAAPVLAGAVPVASALCSTVLACSLAAPGEALPVSV